MISILCPTRGRPAYARRLVESVTLTADDPEAVQVVFYVDDDDPARSEVIGLTQPDTGGTPDVSVVPGPRILLSQAWNECWGEASYDILMHAGDDIVFETPGWDAIVADAFDGYPDHIVFVHGADGHQPLSFGTHGFVHRLWAETLGYFVPPYFACDWNDTWLNDVANLIGRRHYVPIVTRHYHPAWGTRPLDQTDHDRMAAGQRDNVDQLYRDLLPQREADAAKLRQIIQRYSLTDGALAPTQTSTS